MGRATATCREGKQSLVNFAAGVSRTCTMHVQTRLDFPAFSVVSGGSPLLPVGAVLRSYNCDRFWWVSALKIRRIPFSTPPTNDISLFACSCGRPRSPCLFCPFQAPAHKPCTTLVSRPFAHTGNELPRRVRFSHLCGLCFVRATGCPCPLQPRPRQRWEQRHHHQRQQHQLFSSRWFPDAQSEKGPA